MSNLLDAARALGPRIRELAPSIEQERCLAPELVAALGRAGVWRACVPKAVGGLEVPLAELVEVFEELARADGSVGWCAMIGGTSGLFYAYLDPDTARAMVTPEGCTGGIVAPSGRATEVDGGFRVTGRWPFGSGVGHCEWMGLGTIVMDGDVPRMRDSGTPDVRTVLVRRGEFEIVDTWHVSGLRGTGSHDVVLNDVFVRSERVCVLGSRDQHDGTLYRFPLFGVLALAVASVCLGIARSAIDELRELASSKTPTGSRRRLADRAHVQMEVARATSELEAARAFVFNAIEQAWDDAVSGAEPTLEQRVRVRLAATNAARASADAVDRMYEAGGATSIYATSRLQRDFRDIHTATQHLVVSPATYELTGRILLGVETEVSLL